MYTHMCISLSLYIYIYIFTYIHHVISVIKISNIEGSGPGYPLLLAITVNQHVPRHQGCAHPLLRVPIEAVHVLFQQTRNTILHAMI